MTRPPGSPGVRIALGWRPLAGEFLGTLALVGIGTGAIVVGARAGGAPLGLIAVAWFFAVAIPCFAFVGWSGAHLNPAVTLTLAAAGRFSWARVPAYWASQLAGAVLASVIVRTGIGPFATLGATILRGPNVPLEFVGEAGFTFLLTAVVLQLNRRSIGADSAWLFAPAAVVLLSTVVIGPWTGSSLNPARTIGPDLVSGTWNGIGLYLTAVPTGALLAVTADRLRDRLRRAASPGP